MIKLNAEHIKSADPVVYLVNVVTNRLSLYGIHSELFTVLIELYNNSLVHGELELDSGLKQFDDGFLSTYDVARREAFGIIERQYYYICRMSTS